MPCCLFVHLAIFLIPKKIRYILNQIKKAALFAVKTSNSVDILILIPSICDICIVMLHIPLDTFSFYCTWYVVCDN